MKNKKLNSHTKPLDLEIEKTEIQQEGSVTVLGKTFANDEERRKYFRAELRAKLPELRQIEGFPIGTDDDIINLSDPPYYTACPNPWLNDFITKWEQEKLQLESEGKRQHNFVVTEPYAADVSEGKNNPIYMAHSYHTKVPHTAILKFINHYSQPGDIIFDGFCGTGMAGVAANLCGEKNDPNNFRHTILNDLSPSASLISASYNLEFSVNRFIKVCKDVIDKVTEEFGYLYKTENDEEVMYYIWSEVYVCPNCNTELNLWKNSVSKDTKTIKDSFLCPNCKLSCNKHNVRKIWDSNYDEIAKKVVTTMRREPVRVNFRMKGGQRNERELSSYDLSLLNRIENINLNLAPAKLKDGEKTTPIKRSHGYEYAHQFYSKRNLIILNRIFELLPKEPIFAAWFTSVLPNSSKMYKFRTDRKGGIMTGTIFLPSFSIEINPFNLLKAKIRDYSMMKYSPMQKGVIQVGSATILPNISKNSIDYIFVDPPFGSNIMYSELNSLSESWIRLLTNDTEEAIVNKVQGKTLYEYQELMRKSFREFYRILKPGKWMTVEFSNTSASVWNTIQNSLQSMGFIVASVTALDKKQGSYNAVTSTTAVKQDLIISCFKPTEELLNKFENREPESNVWDFVDELISRLPVHLEHDRKTTAIVERSPKILYDRMISFYVQHGYPVPLNAQEFQAGLRERYAEREGMFFTPSQAAKYDTLRKSTDGFQATMFFVDSEQGGIAWLNSELVNPQTYQDLQPKWMQAIQGVRKGDILPELMQILEENFIKEADGKWRKPNLQDDVDLAALRHKALMHEFKIYAEVAQKPRGKIKEARLEALRAGFKQCYQDKDFATIVSVGDRIPQNLLTEDEQLLQFYEIASTRV